MKRDRVLQFVLLAVLVLSLALLLLLRTGYVTSVCWSDIPVEEGCRTGLIISSIQAVVMTGHFLLLYLCVIRWRISKWWDAAFLAVNLLSTVPWMVLMIPSLPETRLICFFITAMGEILFRIAFLFRKTR